MVMGFVSKRMKCMGNWFTTGWWKGFRSYFIKVQQRPNYNCINNVKRGRFFKFQNSFHYELIINSIDL